MENWFPANIRVISIEMDPTSGEAKVSLSFFPCFAHRPTRNSEPVQRVGQLVARYARRGISCFGSRRSRM